MLVVMVTVLAVVADESCSVVAEESIRNRHTCYNKRKYLVAAAAAVGVATSSPVDSLVAVDTQRDLSAQAENFVDKYDCFRLRRHRMS